MFYTKTYRERKKTYNQTKKTQRAALRWIELHTNTIRGPTEIKVETATGTRQAQPTLVHHPNHPIKKTRHKSHDTPLPAFSTNRN